MKKLVSLMLVLAMMTVLFNACAKTTPAEDAQASESQDIVQNTRCFRNALMVSNFIHYQRTK